MITVRGAGRRAWRRHRSSATDRVSGTCSDRAGRARRAGVTVSTARATSSNVRASSAGSASTTATPGHRAFGFAPAHPARHTVRARASADAARTRSRLPIRSRTTTGTAAQLGIAAAGRDHRPVGAPHTTRPRRRLPAHRATRPARARCRAGAPFASTRTWSSRVSSAPLPVAQAGPRAAFGVHAHRCFDRPRTDRDEHRRALTRAGDQPARVAGPQPQRDRRRDQRDAVEQRGDHRAPPIGRTAPDHRAPFELDARVGRGARTERAVRVDDRGPLPRLRRRRRERERDRRDPDPADPVDRHRRAAAQPAAREQRAERPGDREPAFARGEERPDLRRASSEIEDRPPPPPTVSNIRSIGKRALVRSATALRYWTGEGLYSRPRASKDQPASSP